MMDLALLELQPLYSAYGDRVLAGVPLARYTTARVGGRADALLKARSGRELVEVVSLCWKHHWPFVILGGGSNVLISDAGFRGLVVLNRAKRARFNERSEPPTVWAESGASFGLLARQAAMRGFSGLEWAAGIPGTLGGAVVGNAGAHGGDTAGNLQMAEILHRIDEKPAVAFQREKWPVERLEYTYRSSFLKRHPGAAVVLAAQLKLERSTLELARSRLNEFGRRRRRTQPAGASMGSMFKNPPGDYAGRLIEAAGLKGKRIGGAEISPIHANFFINLGDASAQDVYSLIQLACQSVAEKFGVNLELEIELLGEW